MEYVKREILQAVTTGLTPTTGGYKYVIIPDLNAVYHMKINLTQNTRETGFFDVYPYGYGYAAFGIGEDLLFDDNFI